MGLSLILFDTNHIKAYVFGTDRLKEIRGASSLLDGLNRETMEAAGENHKAKKIYANGGTGLFVVDSARAEDFERDVKRAYSNKTGGVASVACAVQKLPPGVPQNLQDPQQFEALLDYPLEHELQWLDYRLQEAKGSPVGLVMLPSHSFMRPCDACGVNYASKEMSPPGEAEKFYCNGCREKRREEEKGLEAYLWHRILGRLKEVNYEFSDNPEVGPPNDFNEFSLFSRGKNYMGLIYADGNNMGMKLNKDTLRKKQDLAIRVDDAIHQAMALAIKQHLPIVDIKRDNRTTEIYPFDILLVGGDDVVMVTDATKALDVALTIVQEFRRIMNPADAPKTQSEAERFSISAGVVLAPVKYPFGLLVDTAESALKFAKKSGSKDENDATRINFYTVTGGSDADFSDIHRDVYHKMDKKHEFYATLRPYTVEELQKLLAVIRKGQAAKLGRTKLHQFRAAILKKNLASSVQEGMAALGSMRESQGKQIVRQVYSFGNSGIEASNLADPINGFPRVTFPWFLDKDKGKGGRDIYRTPLLDFIELYDFVAREEGQE